MNLQKVKAYLNRLRRITNRALNHGQSDSKGSLNFQHDLQGRFCGNPFRQIDIYEKGNVYACCPDWLHSSLGNLNKSSIEENTFVLILPN